MIFPVHFFGIGNDFLIHEILHHRLQFLLLFG